METGLIAETKINKTRQMRLSTWVFGTANSLDKISEPLLSRFLVLEIPEYTFEQFEQIALPKLKKKGLDGAISSLIVEKAWNEIKFKDIRDSLKIGRLFIVLKKYRRFFEYQATIREFEIPSPIHFY